MTEKCTWQPIETAPKDGTTILGYWVNGEMHTGSICDGEWIPAWDHGNENWSMPTQWMLIEPPGSNEHDQIMKAIEAAHREYPKEKS